MKKMIGGLIGALLCVAGCREVRIEDGDGAGGGASSSTAVMQTSSSSSACGDLANDPMNCGACGHDCGGGACIAGACQPFPIAEGFLPGDLAQDASSLFVTNSDSGDVLRFSKKGGDPVVAAHGDAEAWRLTLLGDDVLWGGAQGIWRAPKAGGAAFQLMDSPISVGPIASDGYTTYFSTVEGFGKVGSVPANGGKAETLVNYASLAYDVALHPGVKDYSSLYWVSQDAGKGELHMLHLDGVSAPLVLASGMSIATKILVAPEGVYVADSGFEGGVARVGSSGIVESLIAGQPVPAGLAIDDDHLYVTLLGTDGTDGAILRVGRFEATGLDVVASGLSYPSSIVADDEALYWLEQPGAVMKLMK